MSDLETIAMAILDINKEWIEKNLPESQSKYYALLSIEECRVHVAETFASYDEKELKN